MAGPRPDGLGKLSAWYESGNRGTEAVGYDNRGKLSLGKYQIAHGVGTLKTFLDWCRKSFPSIAAELSPLYDTITGTVADKKGKFAKKWVELAALPQFRLGVAEHEFIAVTHYDAAFDQLPEDLKAGIREWRALQDVLWSTAVQHGPGGAKTVFTGTYVAGSAPEAWVERIYAARARRLGGLTPDVVAGVRNRYEHEKSDALRIIGEQRRLGAPTVDRIREAQKKLNLLAITNPRLTEDGLFGPKTFAAIQKFQEANGIQPITGVLDEETWAKLKEV